MIICIEKNKILIINAIINIGNKVFSSPIPHNFILPSSLKNIGGLQENDRIIIKIYRRIAYDISVLSSKIIIMIYIFHYDFILILFFKYFTKFHEGV
jgi:hypothetical protein